MSSHTSIDEMIDEIINEYEWTNDVVELMFHPIPPLSAYENCPEAQHSANLSPWWEENDHSHSWDGPLTSSMYQEWIREGYAIYPVSLHPAEIVWGE